ncbi:MAG: tyrosinase family protein [Chloroflexia bacterium]|nr:tyrosinase family protein [Chloroflexia bacterium]
MAVRCRKNQATLTAAEKARFVAAVLALKANGTFDTYVADHMGAMPNAHRGPAFLPWHREFLRRFELDLQKIDPQVTLPYWNWTVDNSVTSSLWDPSFLGGNGRPADGWVTTGPFAHSTGNWNLIHDGPALRRRFGMSAASLPTPFDLNLAMSDATYDVSPWDRFSTSGFRNKLEGWINGPQLHNLVHVWVGGSMGPMSSPNDPVFFLHHCFVDKLWADWQRMHPGSGYLPVSGGPAGHNLGNAMQPWLGRGETVTSASLLDHHALGYAYDNEGICLPKLKFGDDVPTRKFWDDFPTLKFRDDIPTLKMFDDPPTLKFRDDLQTIKVLDDQPTLKFRDETPPTLKFRDEGPPKIKALDDVGGGGTLSKAVDDVKIPALDDPNLGKAQQDLVDPVGRFGRPAPFVLSTPHHSMAWAQDQPGVLEAAAVQLESELTQLGAVIAEREEAQQQGQLTAQEVDVLQQLRADYAAVMVEYQQILGGGTA